MDVTQNALGTRFGIEEIEAVTRAMQSGHTSGLTSDGEGANFAKEFAEYCGVEFALPLNGACNALSIAARLVDLQPGDEIISNPITYIATAIYVLDTPGPTPPTLRHCPFEHVGRTYFPADEELELTDPVVLRGW